ncbi:coiled-coil domain-containing protein 170-like [Sorex araneus]|uniref:coiled-coil domain-containing protein 170-like n=1 Tax=Sorex araneus TaxID=42254 RepID=UPI002433CB3A|nr:coiled-coil domain-containing protein 170-like [Sorex araneus]
MESHYQKFLGQLAILLSNSEGPIPATEKAVKERIQEIGANEQSWKSRTEGLQQEIQMLTRQLEQLHHHRKETTQESFQMKEQYKGQKIPQCLEGKIENAKTKNSQIDEHSRMFKHLEKDSMQQKLLTIQQNLEISTTQRLEEKIQKLQKHLSDLKLSNKNMKSQLTRVNILKDKTIKKLRQSLIKAETMRGKTLMKTDNLRTASDSAKHEERMVKEKNQQVLKASSPELCPAKSSLEEVSGKQELVDFQETIMKMLGFNVKAAHKEIINHLRLVIQVYEASEKSKTNPDCETGKENE